MTKCLRLLPLLLVFSCLPVFAEQGWVEVRSPHFTVITDDGPKQGREIALRFERMRTVFGQIFRRSKISLPVPLQIIAFRNGKEMKPFVPVFKGKAVEVSGFFQQGDDRSYILLDMSAENKWEAVYHEYAHQLLNGNFPRLAPWFDEGFAQYFAAMQINGESYRIGDPPEGAWDTLQRNRLMPVSALFTVVHRSETYYQSGDPRHLFYSQSWLLVHLLFDQNRVKQALDYFRFVNDEHVPVEQAITRAFGKDTKQLDQELADYFRLNRGKALIGKVAETFDLNSFAVTSVDPLNLRVTLADVRFQSPDHRAEAAREYEQILKEKPDTSAAHRGLGYVSLSEGDFGKALEHFHQAARLSSTDPRVYYFSAVVFARNFMTSGKSLAENLQEMKTDLQKAIELDPSFADAYSVLGFANMAEGDYAGAVTNCKKAAELNPRNEMYALNLGRAYLGAGRFDEAKPIFEKLQESSDRTIAYPAQQALARTDRASYNAGAAEGHRMPETYDAPQWRRSQEEIEREPEKPVAVAPDTRPIKYLRGQLVSVDCSDAPKATVTVSAAGKTLRMLTPDTKKLLLIGADEFSCSWTNRKVLINYKPGGQADGDLVSLEVQ